MESAGRQSAHFARCAERDSTRLGTSSARRGAQPMRLTFPELYMGRESVQINIPPCHAGNLCRDSLTSHCRARTAVADTQHIWCSNHQDSLDVVLQRVRSRYVQQAVMAVHFSSLRSVRASAAPLRQTDRRVAQNEFVMSRRKNAPSLRQSPVNCLLSAVRKRDRQIRRVTPRRHDGDRPSHAASPAIIQPIHVRRNEPRFGVARLDQSRVSDFGLAGAGLTP